MDLGDQRAGGVDGLQTPLGRLPADLRRHAVGRVEQVRALGHFGQIVDEHDPLPPEPLDHPFVVDDLVVDVQRRAVGLDRQLQGLDRHVHARTEPTRPGQNDLAWFPHSLKDIIMGEGAGGQGPGIRGTRSSRGLGRDGCDAASEQPDMSAG